MSWWQSFFDAEYLRLWSAFLTPERTSDEAAGLWAVLGLREGARLLDAPCGQGRLSRALAERGASVLGVDQSAPLIAAAEEARAGLPGERLRYLRHDLRQPLPAGSEGAFDAAVNVYSSIGYGTEDDDLAIFSTLAAALRPGGHLFLDTMHRDAAAASFARGFKNVARLPDGTIFMEEPRLDPVSGRIETCWYWSGPAGTGAKPASLRCYSITELVRLLERAGLRFISLHRGCSTDPFRAEGPDMGGRVGILTQRL